jgi:hypothetical protein
MRGLGADNDEGNIVYVAVTITWDIQANESFLSPAKAEYRTAISCLSKFISFHYVFPNNRTPVLTNEVPVGFTVVS